MLNGGLTLRPKFAACRYGVNMGGSRKRWRTFVWVCAICGIVAALFYLVFVAISCYFGVDDGYALWGTAEVVIGYMKSHDGNWPRGWDNLQKQFAVNNGRVPGWDFSKFKSRIRIDFNADPNQLRKISQGPRATKFKVIWPTFDWGIRIGDDPNDLIRDYLQSADKSEPATDRKNLTGTQLPAEGRDRKAGHD